MLTPLLINEMGLIHAKEVHYTRTTSEETRFERKRTQLVNAEYEH